MPLDWDRPNGRTIKLALIRHLASKPAERIGTLFMNPGGPADTGIGNVQSNPEGWDSIGGGCFDFVSWDPRGTTGSTKVKCFRSTPRSLASGPATLSRRRGRKRSALCPTPPPSRGCGEVSGWLLPHISTADTARDLDHLRALLGEEKLNYLGLSYDSYLGETYANMLPDRVRAMVLDAIVDPVRYSKSAESRLVMFSDAADELFGQVLSLCESAGPERCALAGGTRSRAERWKRLLARAKRRPIPAPNANLHGVARDRLSYSDLLNSVRDGLFDPARYPQAASDIDAALRGDGSALESAASSIRSPTGWATGAVQAAITCVDGPARKGPGAWPQVFKRLKQNSMLGGPFFSRRSGRPAPPGRCGAKTHTGGRGTPRPRIRSC